MAPAQCFARRGSTVHPGSLLSPLPGTHLFCRPSVLLGRLLLIGVGLEMAVAHGGHRGGRCSGCFRLLRGLLLSLLHLRIRACLCCHGDQHACIGMKERECDEREGQRGHDRTERGGQEPHAERDRWRQMDKEPQREGGGGRDRGREDGERVQRSEGSAAAAEVTDPHPPFAHIAPQGLQSLGPGLESGPFLGTRRVSPGGPTLPRAPGTVRDHLQAGPGPGCPSYHSTWHTAAPQPMLDKLNSTQRALGSQSFQLRH